MGMQGGGERLARPSKAGHGTCSDIISTRPIPSNLSSSPPSAPKPEQPPAPEQQRVQAVQQRHNELAVQQRQVRPRRWRRAVLPAQRALHRAQAQHPAMHRLLLQGRTNRRVTDEAGPGMGSFWQNEQHAPAHACNIVGRHPCPLPTPQQHPPLASQSCEACPAATRRPAHRCWPVPRRLRLPGTVLTWPTAWLRHGPRPRLPPCLLRLGAPRRLLLLPRCCRPEER